MNVNSEGLQCVYCHTEVKQESRTQMVCGQCGAVYPVVNGIPIMTRRARQVVAAYAKNVIATREKMENRREQLVQVGKATDHALSSRSRRMVDAISSNIALMNEQCRPIFEYVGNDKSLDDMIAWVVVQGGYDYIKLLPYFYQDWCGTDQYAEVVRHAESALAKYCYDRVSLVVLGAGACGLPHSLSHNFERSYAVDLALPSLLTAKNLIGGSGFSMRLEKAGWKKVEVSAPAESRNSIRFVAANVMNTPFADESQSLVVTQYLLDIVPNAEWFMHEVYRILEPGGVWLSVSKPFSWPDDPEGLGARMLAEVPSILQALGFGVQQADMVRFRMLSMEDVYEGGDRSDEEVHVFVAQKEHREVAGVGRSVRGRMRSERDRAWHQVPRLVKVRDVAVVQKKRYGVNGLENIDGVEMMGGFLPVAREFMPIVNALFDGIDGKRTVRELWHGVRDQGVDLSSQDFMELICCLNGEYFVLELYD